MNFKFLILFIAVCYVNFISVVDSLPVDSSSVINEKLNVNNDAKKIESSAIKNVSTESVKPGIELLPPEVSITDPNKKLLRTVREDKFGKIIHPEASTGLRPDQIFDFNDYSRYLSYKEKERKEQEKKEKKESIVNSPNEKADDVLHYSSNGFKIRNENVKSRSTNGKSTRPFVIPINIHTKNILALPSTINPGVAQNSPLISTLYPPQIGQSLYPNDLLNNQFTSSSLYTPTLNNQLTSSSLYTPTLNYPFTYPTLLQSIYSPNNQLNGGLLLSNQLPSVQSLSNNYLTSPNIAIRASTINPTPILSPEEIEIRRTLIPQISTNLGLDYTNRIVSPLSTNQYLYGSRSLNSLVIPPNLLGRTSLNGINSLDYGLSSSNLLQTQSYPLVYTIPTNYPQYQSVAYQPMIVPQFTSPSIIPPTSQSIITQQPQITTTNFTPRRTVITTTETTTNNVQPFTDSVTTTANSPPVVPGITENEANSNDKPLFYANQNAALRLSMPYDSSLYSGVYPNRITDPNFLQASFVSRYPVSSYHRNYPYSSLTYPISSMTYPYSSGSPYYPRPITQYPGIYSSGQVYGPYNGVGYVSPMHYSADLSSLSNENIKEEEKDKPIAAKEQVTDKTNNLMYTIKSSKSELKETISRLDDANKIKLDKAAA